MTDDRRKYYERAFQSFCNANLLFEQIRHVLGCEVADTYDDPATTVIDIGCDQLMSLYLEEEFQIPYIWDELCEGLYDCLSDSKWGEEKFSLDKFDDMIVQCLEELEDRESMYPEEYDNDRECVL